MSGRFESKPGASSLVHDELERRAAPAAVGKRTLTEQLSPPVIQRKAVGAPTSAGGTPGAPTNAGGTPGAPTSGGRPLEPEVQAKMSAAFGADFSGVRVHEGDHVTRAGAVAYAQGNDLHFAPGQYDPHSAHGQEVLGHELAHLVQQREGRVAATVQAFGMAVNDDAGLEHEADEMGARAARGEPARPALTEAAPPAATGGGAPIQRMLIQGVESTSMTLQQILFAKDRAQTPAERAALLQRCYELLEAASNPPYRQAIANTIEELQGSAQASQRPAKRNQTAEDDSDEEMTDAFGTGKKKKDAAGGVAKQVSFKLIADKSAAAYTNIAERITGQVPAQAQPSPPGYIAQVPTHVGGVAPGEIAAKYEHEAFDNPQEAASRLRIAIGVNGYRDVDDNNRAAVQAMVNSASSQVHAATLGFLWDPMWEKTTAGEGREPTTEPMTASAVAADADAARLKQEDPTYFSKQESNKTSGATRQGKVPYGRIRDHIKDHNATARLTKELAALHGHVYVHVGDDDVKSMRAQQGKGVPTQHGEALGLLSRYDALLAQHAQATGSLPLLATGGYEFKRQADGGDIADDSRDAAITLLAHQLDRRIREILVQHLGPFAVYYPEPNTIYMVTPENSRLADTDPGKPIFHDPNDPTGGGSAESQQMVARLREMNPGGTAIYNPRASITTETSDRFKEGENHFHNAVETQTADPVLIKHVVGQNQSHASSGMWIDAVKQGIQGASTKVPQTFIVEVINAYTVTGSDFDRKARKKLTADEFRTFLTTTLTQPVPKAELKQSSKKHAQTEVGQRVINAAIASNAAIVEAIRQTIAMVAGSGELKYKGSPEK